MVAAKESLLCPIFHGKTSAVTIFRGTLYQDLKAWFPFLVHLNSFWF